VSGKLSLAIMNDQEPIAYNAEVVFKNVMGQIASGILLQDDSWCDVHEFEVVSYNSSSVFFPKKGEIIAGSAVSSTWSNLSPSDMDVYFNTYDQIVEFVRANEGRNLLDTEIQALNKSKNVHISFGRTVINAILYDFKSEIDIISKFDIRASSMAFNPQTSKLFTINSAIEDAMARRIVFNPFPNRTSLCRLLKYIQKGYEIDRYQMAVFTELIKNPTIHNATVELTTGQYGAITDDEIPF